MDERERSAVRRCIPCILVLLLAISLAGCAPAPSAQLPTETPAPTQPPTATLTQEPSATPVPPTDTPVPPTDTPAPPTPTPTPQILPPAAPVIDPAGPEITILAGKNEAFRASATGADGYTWELQGDGKISATEGDAVLYSAPAQAVPGGTKGLLIVTAHNKGGKSPQTSLIINVTAPKAAASIKLDDLAVPAGWMVGAGNPGDFIQLGTGTNCHTGADCLRLSYKNGAQWGAINWWPLACGASGTPEAWAKVQSGTCGVNVLKMGKLSSVSRLTFWARGERGGEVVEFTVGATNLLPVPGSSTSKVSLKPDWEQHTIDLQGMDLTNAVILFFWIATDPDNPQGAVFYLDDIQFEGVAR